MSTYAQKATRIAYAASQFATVFFQFAGSISSYYEYESAHSRTRIRKTEQYPIAFLISAAAASIFLVTADKFQGVKITEEDEHESFTMKYGFTYNEAPRNWKSNLTESAYLAFATLLTIVNNYFTIAGIKAYIDAFYHPNDVQPILPLNTLGLFLMFTKTLLGDLPFNLTNASFEAAEEIKKDITGSKEGPLVSLLVKPLANKFGLFWITTFGTIAHTLWDFAGLFLCIPPQAFLSGAKYPYVFWPLIVTSSIVFLTPLIIVNLIQTRYFEAKESEINLKPFIKNNHNPLLPKPKEAKSLLYKVLVSRPWLKTPLRYGFYTQGPLHAFADAMPILLYLRHALTGSLGERLLVALPMATFFWLASAKGSNESEVKHSLHHFSHEFRFIGKRRVTADNNCRSRPGLAT